MRMNKFLIIATALVSGLTFAKPVKKGKGKKKPAPAAAEPAAAAPAAAPSADASEAPAPMEHKYSGAYGMAGCGLGPMLIKPDGFVQVFAATINGISANQTFGITFGSLECNPTGAKTAAMEQRVFVESNLVSLNREAASGEGETLAAFADLLGCDATLFSKVSKENYGQLYQNGEAHAILSGYKTLLANQCSRII